MLQIMTLCAAIYKHYLHKITCFGMPNPIESVAFLIFFNLACQAFLSEFQTANEEDAEKCDIPPDANQTDVSNLLRRIRFAIKKLRSSPAQKKVYELQCKAAEVKPNMLQLDCRTRWNSTYDMLSILYKQRKAFDYWLATDPQVNKVKLGYLKLTTEEWDMVKQMITHLKGFEECTKLASGSHYVTLSMIMPAFIELFTYIESRTADNSVNERIKIALTKAHKILGKYYNFTDDSIYYLAAVILDPRFKAEYLRIKGFDTCYPGLLDDTLLEIKQLADRLKDAPPENSNQQQSEVKDEGDEDNLLRRMFAHTASKNDMCELESYLNLQTEAQSVDPLQWWKSHQSQFPSLSKLAMIVLSIAGSSVSVERIFNIGRDVIALRRSALEALSISELMFGNHYLKNKEEK